MLEYTKTILQKVSFNRELFRKELLKSKRWLRREELILLQAWCLVTFNEQYSDVLREVFINIAR